MAKKKTGKVKPDAGDKLVKELRAEVKRLETGLKKAEGKVERWRSKADEHKAEATKALAKLVKLEKKIVKDLAATSSARGRLPRDPAPTAIKRPATVAADPAPPVVVPDRKSTAPKLSGDVTSTKVDTSWTIVRLREEARARGVAYSGKTKAQLLAALR